MRHSTVARLGSLTGFALGLFVAAGLGVPAESAAQGLTPPLPFVALAPCRLVDTRGNGFGGPFGPPALANGVARDFPLAGQCGIPADALAVSLNVTAVDADGPGFLMLGPAGGALATVSTLNYLAGQTVANAALAPLGPGGLTVVAGVSGTDLILDVNGYFVDAGASAGGGPVAVGSGGTGSTTPAGARSNLGAAAAGANTDITSLSGLTNLAMPGALSAGSLTGSGAGLTNLNPANLGPGTAAISISGDAATAGTATSAASFTGALAGDVTGT